MVVIPEASLPQNLSTLCPLLNPKSRALNPEIITNLKPIAPNSLSLKLQTLKPLSPKGDFRGGEAGARLGVVLESVGSGLRVEGLSLGA